MGLDILASVIRGGINLAKSNYDAVNDGGDVTDAQFADSIVFEYERGNDGVWRAMANGTTDLDGVAAAGADANVVLTRSGADLEVSNTTGSSFTITKLRVINAHVRDVNLVAIGPLLVPSTPVSISVPNNEIFKLNSITFEMQEEV